MVKKLNVGCAGDIKKGFVNLDFVKQEGVDVVHDLNKFPWPFKEDTFDEIYASHVLEHINDLVKVMEEIHRISKKGAKIIIRGPHFSCGVSYRDPTHKRFFSYFTFEYFCNPEEYYKRKEIGLFEIKRRKLNFTRLAFKSLNKIFNPVINSNPEIYERFFCWILPCSGALFELEVVK
ncbi:MAG: methyltransferase domain-containing protein [Candidatus Pacearchaeota archaeon]|nr:methyltransferase domain-containing protein [Candidatus Pacearchaeota archaeon]